MRQDTRAAGIKTTLVLFFIFFARSYEPKEQPTSNWIKYIRSANDTKKKRKEKEKHLLGNQSRNVNIANHGSVCRGRTRVGRKLRT